MGLNTLDLVIIGCYLAGVTLFGLRFSGGQQTLKGYFLADNAIPWWSWQERSAGAGDVEGGCGQSRIRATPAPGQRQCSPGD